MIGLDSIMSLTLVSVAFVSTAGAECVEATFSGNSTRLLTLTSRRASTHFVEMPTDASFAAMILVDKSSPNDIIASRLVWLSSPRRRTPWMMLRSESKYSRHIPVSSSCFSRGSSSRIISICLC